MGKQNVRSYYNYAIKTIEQEVYYSTRKNVVIFLVRVFRNILIPSVRMTLTMSKMFARSICQTIE